MFYKLWTVHTLQMFSFITASVLLCSSLNPKEIFGLYSVIFLKYWYSFIIIILHLV